MEIIILVIYTIRNILAALFCFLKENAGVKSAPNVIDRGQREANFPSPARVSSSNKNLQVEA